MQKEIKKGEIVIYKSKEGPQLDVRLEEETVWLSQKQIADLFDKDVRTVNEHIKNIYSEKELGKKSTIRNFRIVQIEGKRQIKREIDLYNLDMVLSVGYRVSSKRATQFRVWATNILKQHLIQGYTINRKQIAKNYDAFMKAVTDVQTLLRFFGFYARQN